MQLAYSEAFDPFKATPADLRAEAVSLRFSQYVGMLHSRTALGSCEATVLRWQRYSLVPADPAFHPLGTDAGVHVAAGGNQVAYLVCFLRAALTSSGPVA